MRWLTHPISVGSAGMLASLGMLAALVGVGVFEVAASWGLAIARHLGFGSPYPDRATSGELWFAGFMWLRAPSLFLLELLVGWATYQLLRKTGRFTLGWAVGLPVLVGVVIGLVLWSLFFVGPFWLPSRFGMLWTERAQGAVLILTGMVGWGTAGATFWALVHNGRNAPAA